MHHGEFATAARVIEAEDMETALREAERRLTGLWTMEKDFGWIRQGFCMGVCVVISGRGGEKEWVNQGLGVGRRKG